MSGTLDSMSYSDTRRRWRQRANERGFTVLGLNGEVRRGIVVGGTLRKRPTPSVYVADSFGFFKFPIGWDLVKAIADGYVPQIRLRGQKEIMKSMEQYNALQ